MVISFSTKMVISHPQLRRFCSICLLRKLFHFLRKRSPRIRVFDASSRCICFTNGLARKQVAPSASALAPLFLYFSKMVISHSRLQRFCSMCLLRKLSQKESIRFECKHSRFAFFLRTIFFAFGQAFDRLVTVNLTHCCAYISALSTLYSARDLMSL